MERVLSAAMAGSVMAETAMARGARASRGAKGKTVPGFRP
jgi:hypothetical protein